MSGEEKFKTNKLNVQQVCIELSKADVLADNCLHSDSDWSHKIQTEIDQNIQWRFWNDQSLQMHL